MLLDVGVDEARPVLSAVGVNEVRCVLLSAVGVGMFRCVLLSAVRMDGQTY